MRSSLELKVTKNKFEGASGRVRERLQFVIEKVASDLEGHIKFNIVTNDIIDTGALLLSVVAIKIAENHWIVIVGQYYGFYHEYGTVLIPARPFFWPAVDVVAPVFIDAMAQAIRDGIDG
jgi:hypothetical protein